MDKLSAKNERDDDWRLENEYATLQRGSINVHRKITKQHSPASILLILCYTTEPTPSRHVRMHFTLFLSWNRLHLCLYNGSLPMCFRISIDSHHYKWRDGGTRRAGDTKSMTSTIPSKLQVITLTLDDACL